MSKYRLYERANGVFYLEDVLTGQQASLRTKDRGEAERLAYAKNESARDAMVSREVGLAYLSSADPAARTRNWEWVIDQIIQSKKGETRRRWEVARKDKSFRLIMTLPVVETRAEHFLAVLGRGTVSTNVYLRRIHNFALDMGWLGRCVIVRRQWPAVEHKKRRAITCQEHQLIVANESNPERRDYYELLWFTGSAQKDLAELKSDAIDWNDKTIRFRRSKTGCIVYQKFGPQTEVILRRRPREGFLFPYLATVRSSDRATEFGQRCALLKITGITLHCYRYGWAKRAKKAGYPERCAMVSLGQNSRAVHEHYAGSEVESIPALEIYEQQMNEKILPMARNA